MKEHDETLKNIAEYTKILNDKKEMTKVIIKELDRFKKNYSKERRTVIENGKEAVYIEKKMEELPVVFLMDRFGYCKTVDQSIYERNKETADSENKYIISCLNTDRIGIFTDSGKFHIVKVAELPYGKFRDKSFPIDNYCNYDSSQENILCIDSLEHILNSSVLFVSKYGMSKVVDGMEYDVRTKSTASTKLNEEDQILYIKLINKEEKNHIVLQTKDGCFLKFASTEIPTKKKNAVGVRCIRLNESDEIENVYYISQKNETTITYKEKEIELSKLKLSKRDVKGIKIRL